MTPTAAHAPEVSMQPTMQQPGITFAVDDVAMPSELLPECRTHQTLGQQLESCFDYHGKVVKDIYYHPLLAAVYTAFSQHRPLVLSPDAVWITIAQGVGHHMAIHGEQLRPRFVSHSDKLELVFTCVDWIEGSPENPWPEAFASWSSQIRDHVGPQVHDTLVCDFSTTGPVERAASQIVMMDIFERYFHYLAYCICGIPSVTLLGTPGDWQRLADKAAGLKVFDLDWWLEHLLPICQQFVRASHGDVDLAHWQSICKLRHRYGGDVINGWVAYLFPYLRAFIGGPCTQRNPIFETGEGFQTLVAPYGLSCVPFLWRNATTGRERLMEAFGGLIGVTQDPTTRALQPKVGWAVRQADKLDVLLRRVSREHRTSPGVRFGEETSFPPDLAGFYHHTNGAVLFPEKDAATCRIVPRGELEGLDWGEDRVKGRTSRGPDGRTWYRFAHLADGSWQAINLDINRSGGPWRENERLRELVSKTRDDFAPICHVSRGTAGRPNQNPVIALSFTEWLERILDNGGKCFWEGSVPYGDAGLFTRPNRPDC
jgi:hypothetical protein